MPLASCINTLLHVWINQYWLDLNVLASFKTQLHETSLEALSHIDKQMDGQIDLSVATANTMAPVW
jgi:hypothetical protein